MNNSPDVTVFCGVPNNGHFTLVFTDDGMIESANCNRGDLYQGLVRAVADLLIEMAQSREPLPEGLEDTSQCMDQVENHVRLLRGIHRRFDEDLAKRISISSAAKRLKKSGMPTELAELMANALISDIAKRHKKEENDESETSV